MEVAAATAFVATFLISNGLFGVMEKHIWLIALTLSATIGTAIWLAAAASLWPFYVLAGVYAVVLVIVIILSIIKAYADAATARMEYNANL